MTKARKPDVEAAPFEADALERALASLGFAAAPIAPPEGLWSRIAAELGSAPPSSPEGIAAERRVKGRWRRLAPGVEIKPLWGKRSFLIRCEPGATVPAHRHRSFEHTLILSGDIEGQWRKGDYLGNPEGPHEAWSTRGGCLVLVQYDA